MRLDEFRIGRFIKELARDALEELDTEAAANVDRVGASWTKEEEELLVKEMGIAMRIVALCHKRNVGGIWARVKMLVKEHRFHEPVDC